MAKKKKIYMNENLLLAPSSFSSLLLHKNILLPHEYLPHLLSFPLIISLLNWGENVLNGQSGLFMPGLNSSCCSCMYFASGCMMCEVNITDGSCLETVALTFSLLRTGNICDSESQAALGQSHCFASHNNNKAQVLHIKKCQIKTIKS